MPLVTTRDLLLDARRGGYAVAAFNIENMEMAQSVIRTADEMRSPVIIQTTPGTVNYAGFDMLRAMVAVEAAKTDMPVAIHLDHGDSYERCAAAIDSGYTSVMIDGSKLPYEENIAVTKAVVDLAAKKNIDVEGELGRVGGKEDTHEVKAGEDIYTDPQQAKDFAERTGVRSLAVAIGTAHGFYKGEPKLDFGRLEKIIGLVNIPIVLHGASGVPDEAVRRAVGLGICKVNFATELRAALTKGVREALRDEAVYDPKVFMKLGKKQVEEIVRHKIQVCGCDNRA
ncbi:class II fructose-1,6-bisphosphate aldolase [Caproiciproducens sp. CPB-2]|uniref:class II fructose-1,6-bisphosphate aldolase n=1 Tax=unclassified Caproiciproducens TaxID=2643836 RepID=UPI0023DA3B63|nr:class II fructose-1,6-bisphosphate aldolase [Caproiciproducens sp. CPB-2]MDF1494624.1 class II fructose-1,6-bisphosphate aldolase [Caproiciproducens sp. CPB-2]